MSGPSTRMGFQYVVLRCVPRVDREEFVNVGVVLYAQQADFLQARCHVDREPLGTRFGFVKAPRSTVVQPGPVHGGTTDDPARELDHLLDRLVL